MGGLGIVRSACDRIEDFKGILKYDFNIKEFLRKQAADFGGYTLVLADTSALGFIGGSTLDGLARILENMCTLSVGFQNSLQW
jgi:hypothetical protein